MLFERATPPGLLIMMSAKPTPLVWALTIWDGTLGEHRKAHPFGVMPPEVFGLAAASYWSIA